MAATLGAEPALRARLIDLLRETDSGLSVGEAESAQIQVRQSPEGERAMGDATTLYADGQITCADAHTMARTLGLEVRVVGAILDALGIKVRRCELGCF